MAVADLFLSALAIYTALGVLFAIAFVAVGAGTIDPAARESGLGFRLTIFPGSVALWPVLLHRWVTQ